MYGYHLSLVNALASERQRPRERPVLDESVIQRVYRLPAGRTEARATTHRARR